MQKGLKEERRRWLEGVDKEFKDFEKRGVWRVIKKKDMPEGRRLIGNKWVFKVKRNGTYRSRLVALGYTQIPGVDYTDNFSAVVHEITMRITLIMWMEKGLDIDQMDIETAFLEGTLDSLRDSPRLKLSSPSA